jgi:hypothetical protein
LLPMRLKIEFAAILALVIAGFALSLYGCVTG